MVSWWTTATVKPSNHAYFMELSYRSDEGDYEFSQFKHLGFSVRCVQD